MPARAGARAHLLAQRAELCTHAVLGALVSLACDARAQLGDVPARVVGERLGVRARHQHVQRAPAPPGPPRDVRARHGPASGCTTSFILTKCQISYRGAETRRRCPARARGARASRSAGRALRGAPLCYRPRCCSGRMPGPAAPAREENARSAGSEGKREEGGGTGLRTVGTGVGATVGREGGSVQ